MQKINDFKQGIIGINNAVNQEMYNKSLDWQKIDIIGNKIIILALNRRISVLKHVDRKDTFATKLMDLALLNEFKVRFKKHFEEKFQLKIRTILKDYDPINQLAGIIIITVQPIKEFLE